MMAEWFIKVWKGVNTCKPYSKKQSIIDSHKGYLYVQRRKFQIIKYTDF